MVNNNASLEIPSFEKPDDFRVVGSGDTVKNLGGERSLLDSLRGLVRQSRGYMQQAKDFALRARGEKEETERLVAQAGGLAESAKTSSVTAEKSALTSRESERESRQEAHQAEKMAQKASTEKDVVRDITDVSLDDIHAAKKAAMQEIEGAIEKTPGIV